MLTFRLIFFLLTLLQFLSLENNRHKSFVQGQIIIIPKHQVTEPFKNNPKWEDFKTAQFDRIKVLGTLVANAWMLIDIAENPDSEYPIQETFLKYHVPAFVNFFKESEARLADGNPYAIMDPAVGIHTMESLFKLSNLPSNELLDKLRIKWMEIDSMALSVHLYFNETTRKMLKNGKNYAPELLKGNDVTFPTWISKGSGESENGTTKSLTLNEIIDTVDSDMEALGSENHLIRGLVKLLSSMTQSNVDNRETLNYYCFGNNEYGVFQDIYDVLTDAALYLCMMDMKKMILDVYLIVYSTFYRPGAVKDSVEERLRLFNLMTDRIKRKIDFEYLEGSDFTELPHPPIFKCDKAPKELGIPTQWGRNLTTGISPSAGATYPYDSQAGPEKEDGNVGYVDDRTPIWDYVEFDKAFHGYLESEIVLSPNAECKGTCRDYKRITPTCKGKGIDCKEIRQSHCDPIESDCMARNQCPEYARNCIRTSQEVSMCKDHRDTRYYNYFQLVDGRTIGLGDNKTEPTCQGGDMLKAKERWEMEFGVILNNPQYCELCLCTCMTPQDPENQHYVNLQPIVADVSEGYIVSAVRFVHIDRVLTLTIEQAKPLKGGDIDAASAKWVTPTAPDKKDRTQTSPLGMKGFLRIHFDVVVGDANQVVTGVRFVKADQAISLQVQMTPISWPAADPSSITLNHEQSTWIESQKYSQERKALKFYQPNAPYRQIGPSMPDVVYNSYAEFGTTDYEQDLAQSTIPFFDVQPVQYYEMRRWLQGIGLLHKGKPRSGGFIAPLIIPSKGKKSS